MGSSALKIEELLFVNKVLVGTQDLRICQIDQTDDRSTDQIQKENGFIWTVVMDKFFQCVHKCPLFLSVC